MSRSMLHCWLKPAVVLSASSARVKSPILTHVKRHPVIIRYRSGITRDGKLTAVHAEAIGDTGPYLNAGRDVMNFVAATLSGPYFVPNARLEAYTVFTNNPICGAMRGYGIPQASFACEAHMDAWHAQSAWIHWRSACAMAWRPACRYPRASPSAKAGGMKACLREAAQLSGWKERGR